MRVSGSLQMLTYLMVFASSAQAIMVKFGTKDGPIEPPTPEPSPSPQPGRDPAPVWEDRYNDIPDPNAHWRPPLFIPHPRYTQIVLNPSTVAPLPLNSAQRFVNAYIPRKPVKADAFEGPTVFSAQALPGAGLRYFFPIQPQALKPTKQEDAKLNHIDTDLAAAQESASDLIWTFEKEFTRRNTRNNQEGTARAPGRHFYQFPVYVQPRHR